MEIFISVKEMFRIIEKMRAYAEVLNSSRNNVLKNFSKIMEIIHVFAHKLYKKDSWSKRLLWGFYTKNQSSSFPKSKNASLIRLKNAFLTIRLKTFP
jgi:hypothetical protein